jgi:ComF family protein
VSMFKALLDLIYPPRCLVCEDFLQEAATDPVVPNGICAACGLGFVRNDGPKCSICGRPFPNGTMPDHWCEGCLRKPPFYEAIGAPFAYEGTVATAILRFKYGGMGRAAAVLGPLLADFAVTWLMKDAPDPLVMPVPLHPKRLRQRGYNQSLLLARHVAERLSAQLDYISLGRPKHTPPQAGLNRDERRKNMRGAFVLERPQSVKDRTVLLVDDVATTGETLNECARTLKKAGCTRVLCLVFARATMVK